MAVGIDVPSVVDFLGTLDVQSEQLFEGIASFVNSVSRRRLGKLDRHSVVDYLRAKAVPSVSMLTALIFIEKIANTDPPPQLLDEITAVDLFAIAMTTASKYLYDIDTVDGSDNASWADVFNMDVQELNQLEIRFLSAINWSLFVAKSEYDQFRSFVHSLSSATSGRPLRSHSTKRSTRDTVARIQLKNKRLRTTAKLLAVLTAACLTSMAKDPGFFFQFESTPGANTRSMYPLGSLTLHTNPTTSPLRCTVNSSVDVIDGSCRLALLTGDHWHSVPLNYTSVSTTASASIVRQLTDVLLACGG
ncbi:Cyclin-dependent protein kinase [Clonorchis sinensis]|uniref:Protein CNPPD1 n=1 Tax=Clonorchis sinensis TaxID=79923 RepID=A0A8T1MXQ0_CLOSI|nr:Cyclin-dependent protein kinase [Clonorchis sinensis]